MANLSNINNKFLVTTGGNVLIGQTAAVGSSILQVTGNSTFAGNVKVNLTSSVAGAISAFDSAGNTIWLTGRSSDGESSVSFRNNADSAYNGRIAATDTLMTFSQASDYTFDGNVGIGTNNPLAVLSIGSGSLTDANIPVQISTSGGTSQRWFGVNKDGSYGLLMGYLNGGSIGDAGAGAYIRNITEDPLYFMVSNSDLAMTIISNKNVGIGTDSPTSKLHLRDPGTNSDVGIKIGNDSRDWNLKVMGSVSDSLQFFTHDNSNVMTILPSGNVGIGVTSPVSTWLSGFDPSTGNGTFKLTSEGWITTPYLTGLAGYYPGQGARPIVWADASGTNLQCWDNTATDGVSLRSSNGTTRLFVREDGNVGIATTSPIDKLNVDGGTGDTSTQDSKLALTRTSSTSNVLAGKMVLKHRDTNFGNLVFQVKTTASSAENSAYYTDAITIDGNSANVGIGTTIANGKLHIADTSSSSTTQYFSAASNTATYSYIKHIDNTVNTAKLTLGTVYGYNVPVDAMTIFNGSVGIGETNPTYKFEVRGSGTNTLQRWTTTEGGALLLTPTNDAANPDWTFIAGTNEDIQIDPANNDSGLIVKYNGYVGIGTASPATKLHVSGNFDPDDAIGYALIENTSVSGGSPENSAINVRNHRGTSQFMQWENAGLRIGSRIITNGGAGDVYFTAGADSTKMVIKAGGNVGINTTSPSYKLAVNGDLRVEGNTSGTSVSFGGLGDFAIDAPGVGGGRFVVKHSSGNVGIGTPSPTYKLHVVSSNNVSIFEDTSDASGAAFIVFNRPGVFSMGSITRNGSANSVSYNTGSDYRLKEDLKDFNALDLVNNITAYDYKWKDVDQRDYGFIAHELKQTLPNVVTGEKDGEKMQGVDYSKLTPILLKAIQEQQEIINDLKSRIETLENK